jgi:basic membrane protein A
MNTQRLILQIQQVNVTRLISILLMAAIAILIMLLGVRMPVSAESDVVGIGLVTDGPVDSPFNDQSIQGMMQAESDLGVAGTVYVPTDTGEYSPLLQQCVIDGKDLCISVGFMMGDATSTVAQLNPDDKFAIVDFAYFDGEGHKTIFENINELTFRIDQAAFLAGYVAAGTTQTGKVGTYGGIPIATVVNFMDGFWYGVQHYNQQNSTNVEVLGWDPETLEGLFTGNFHSYDDGYNMGNYLINEGADIILPVAPIPGEGTAAAAKDRGNTYIIGVDTDWYDTLPGFGDIILTSVMKQIDVAVYDTIESVVDGKFKAGLYIGTLENEGVAIAPFHELDGLVPPQVKDDLIEVAAGIIEGTISVNHPCGIHIGRSLRMCRVNLPVVTR